ncbi:MAG TPA: ATP-dependent DNA helicase RecG [Gammaproteobacteria bacterium]|nr:ATP-dependent DNA helicase RecG [Gammaproteobacteria bacterium]
MPALPPTLDDGVARLPGAGPRVAESLAKLGVRTIRELLFHLPSRYQDRTRLTPLGALRLQQEVVVEGLIQTSQIHFGRRRALLCRIADDTGALTLRFFYFNRAQQLRLEAGRRVRCFGEVRRGPLSLEIVHPEVQLIDDARPDATPLDGALTPIYPTTEGLHQARLRRLTSAALEVLARESEQTDAIDALIARHFHGGARLPTLTAALRCVHRPPPAVDVEALRQGQHPAQQRLAIEELLAHQLTLRQLRKRAQQLTATPLPVPRALRAALLRAFGFALTRAQQRVVHEIDRDLAKPVPMLRLLQGDVGAGKTAVAALAAASALSAGQQVALMAPTELLAEQHGRTLSKWFGGLDVEVLLVTGRLGAGGRRSARTLLAEDRPRLIVGTHALFQDNVAYANLGLVIVDEQHRFGVNQRLALLEKGARDARRPHQLIMTATPIPRTLAMTAYADLDVSMLDELPPNRQPVRTSVLPASRREDIVARIAEACAAGRQAYWVCPLIEESEHLDSQAATDTAAALAQALPQLKIGLVHGRMHEREKDLTMQQFARGAIELLVATTVIEVGVDVPNASLMVIENAERLGLSQLHQLRGRVGRGSAQSDCVLLYKSPLGETARHRLQTMRETNDGFVIAERDLELRGPGEVLGTRQTGIAEFRIANLTRDRRLLPTVQQVADRLLDEAPVLAEQLIARWTVHRAEFAKV